MHIQRRDMLRGLAGLIAASSVTIAQETKRRRVLRVAHLTDIHVFNELRAAEGMAGCLRHVQSQTDKPDMILFGGDCVMDAYGQTRSDTQAQWDLWNRVLKAENSLQFRTCIGNHDIWGWDRSKSKATGNEPDFGKKWAVQALDLPGRYYSFDRAGWHFIALDSVQPGETERMYSAYLDDEQREWLTKDLAKVPSTTPILIWSHVPIVSALPLLGQRAKPVDRLPVGSGQTHTDARAILNLLAKYPNVKLCMSGHIHELEHLELKNIHFFCNGAVCGGWWKGKNQGMDEGYALVDLYDDGSFECRYVNYGWKA